MVLTFVIETGGCNIKDVLCKLDSSECVDTEVGCLPAEIGEPGNSYIIFSAVYIQWQFTTTTLSFSIFDFIPKFYYQH